MILKRIIESRIDYNSRSIYLALVLMAVVFDLLLAYHIEEFRALPMYLKVEIVIRTFPFLLVELSIIIIFYEVLSAFMTIVQPTRNKQIKLNASSMKNLTERLEDAETTIREALQLLASEDCNDDTVTRAAEDAINTIVMLRRTCD